MNDTPYMMPEGCMFAAGPAGEPMPQPVYAADSREQRFSNRLKEKWNALSDEDVIAFHNQPDQFYSRLHEKYGLSREQADADIKDLQVDYEVIDEK